MRKISLGITAFFYLIFPLYALASVKITEIMYDAQGDDSGREWVEVCAFGGGADLSGWYLSEGGMNHKINFNSNENDLILEDNQCAVISNDYKKNNSPAENFRKFLADFPNFSGILLGASFSLKNSGEEILVKDADKSVVDSVFYKEDWGGGGDGKSLQLIDGKWLALASTPGILNSGSGVEEDGAGTDGKFEASADKGGDGIPSHFPTEPQIYAFAGKDTIAIAGAEVAFEGKALGLKKEPLEKAHYLWNFGDGSVSEGREVKHIYQYPADYIVVLNVSSGRYSASDRILVRVIPNRLKISEIGKDYIQLENDSGFDLDISGWYLRKGKKLFKFPEGTMIIRSGKIPVPFSVSGISANKGEKVELLYPNLALAFAYEGSAVSNLPVERIDETAKVKDGKGGGSVSTRNNEVPLSVSGGRKSGAGLASSSAANIVIASRNVNWKIYKMAALVGATISGLFLISFALWRFAGWLKKIRHQ